MGFEQALEQLAGSHDLRLSSWGPYTKRYMGISHVPDPATGLRFDLSVFPALYRRGVQVPNVLWESGYHPWLAAPDLSFFRHRHEIIWKDRLYADVDYCRVDEAAVLIRAACVNHADAPQNLVLHWVASLHFPSAGSRGSLPLRLSRVELPDSGVWLEGLDYAVLSMSEAAHRANLSYDGLIRGEARVPGFVQGLGLGQGFGLHEGDAVTYRVSLPNPLRYTVLLLRYRLPPGAKVRLELLGSAERRVTLSGDGEAEDGVALKEIALGETLSGDVIFTLIPTTHGVPIEIDGLALVPADDIRQLRFEPMKWQHAPERLPTLRDDTLVLKYAYLDQAYGLAWGEKQIRASGDVIPFRVRGLLCDDLDTTLRLYVHDHVHDMLVGPGEGHFTDVFQGPMFLAPGETREIQGLVCCGDPDDVRARLADFDPAGEDWDAHHAEAVTRAVDLAPNPSGARYRFSQERMAATVLTNVVYPVRTRGTWIRHYTPGRWWDSLYTWDSGFIGLGLAELDLDRALDNLNAYVTRPGTGDAAFIHHGSPVPTQFYVFLELWNRTQSEALLTYFYPRLQQYHRFLAGRLGSSTTRDLKSNLIRTWDYFYNSGGWDDYPAQVYVHQHGLESTVTPVVSTAQIIRTAKVLRMMAETLGQPVDEYEEDIGVLSRALQRHAWDEDAGVFGYVCHDEEGEPAGLLRHESGVNYNLGMDGASPLVAGICTPEQESRLVTALMSEGRMWTRYGLSTVDQSAPYYREDGYWNGAVWMPHQWFFWKAMLDLGRADEAHRIASTGLDVWQQEVARSYNCFEHFIVRNGRGAGWHHFGGLSTPVLAWYGAYHRPGRLTVGLDMWVEALDIAEDRTVLTARLRHTGPPHHTPVVIAVLAPGEYTATWQGEPVRTEARYPGTVEVYLPAGAKTGELRVTRA
ncbi:MAG: MGH1-like glycoside hydrolase domain-containing protein [Anaerolineae bacterium]